MNKFDLLNKINKIASYLENNGNLEAANDLNDVFMKVSKSKLPGEMEGGHKSAPKGYPKKKKEYADPANFKYPLDTEKHVRAAWSYIHQERNRKQYTPAQFKAMCERIKKAGKKFGIEYSED